MTTPAKMAASLSRTSFGVTLSMDPSQVSLANAYDVLNQSVSAAIDKARDLVVADRSGQVSYNCPVSPLLPNAQPAPGSVALSVLADCGIPMVGQFGPFLENLHSELSAVTLPFVGFGTASRFGRDTVAPLWSPPLLLKIIPIDFAHLNNYYQLVNYLTRLNPADDIWQGPRPNQWFNQFGNALKTYMTDLFAGQFIDRNGTAVSFDLNSPVNGINHLDFKQISPQLAGGIVSALVEFLGDQLFNVKFYSADILGAYRDCRTSASSAGGTADDLATLSKSIELGSIAENDSIRLLGLTAIQAKQLLMTGYLGAANDPVPQSILDLKDGSDIPVACDPLNSGASIVPLVRSGVARLVLAKIAQLDPSYVSQLASVARSTDAINKIKNKTSALQTSFTCFKAGVILANLECNFIKDGTTGQQHGDCALDSGRSIEENGDNFDYADLVGRLVSFGGTTAEKSVRSIVGGLIRGVAIASLQNEVIAEVVASLAGGLSRKYVEYATCTGITGYIEGANGVDAKTKQDSLTILAKYLGLLSG